MDYQLLIVVALLGLAAVGIVVGVANDAVNFLNSSFGSKVAPIKIILIVAGLGIITGVTFSSGMMEVARKGIFNPQFFDLEELLIIFFAVMIQNILLLDLFNTYGLPTSTTVSVVFGLFGGAVAISFLKIYNNSEALNNIIQYINVGKVFAIFTAIFLSVLVAFIAGFFFQYITRLIFSFNFGDKIKRWGSIWGGVCLTIITYFIIIKGAKGASFIDESVLFWIRSNTLLVSVICLVFWVFILFTLKFLFKISALNVIVLVGTFALAMAFAANDLVNFIGAPLAGLNAYNIASDFANPSSVTMEALAKPFKTDTLLLLAAGAVMVVTLYLSKKARTVSKTEINLGRQDEGYERFESLYVSRILVRSTISASNRLRKIFPDKFNNWINSRFNTSYYEENSKKDADAPAFDLLRASVNLVVASALIAWGTSLKLPLSTTYVTFITAMATALADRAWGRESAVYRVSGVFTVVGGWFFTAIIAALIAGVIAIVLFYGGLALYIVFLLLTAFVVYKSYAVHKKRDKYMSDREKELIAPKTPEENLDLLIKKVSDYLAEISRLVDESYSGLFSGGELKYLKKAKKQAVKLQDEVGFLMADAMKTVQYSKDEQLEAGHIYAKAIGSLHEMSSRVIYITNQNFCHFDNNHAPFSDDEIERLKVVLGEFKEIIKYTVDRLRSKDFESLKSLDSAKEDFRDLVEKSNKKQMKRIKKAQSKKRRSMLFVSNLDDVEGIIINIERVVRAFKELYDENNNDLTLNEESITGSEEN